MYSRREAEGVKYAVRELWAALIGWVRIRSASQLGPRDSKRPQISHSVLGPLCPHPAAPQGPSPLRPRVLEGPTLCECVQ
jgi:hypothetical protein